MTFPQTPLDVAVEIDLAGTWTDITDYVYVRDGLAITRGRADEASQVDRGTARMTLDNRDGRFTPRNPMGAYYGLLTRNTPLRIGVKRGDVRLDLPGGEEDRISAPDATALGITGDIDIRLDVTVTSWLGPEFEGKDLCAKYETTGDQRSWALQVNDDGKMAFTWSSAGTFATVSTVLSTESIPLGPGRLALRVTLDVNNGASGKTLTFYTADTIAGPWDQLGDMVTTVGTTSVFDSSAPVEIGDIDDLVGINGTDNVTVPLAGQVNAFELRSGIGGTAVANPVFTAQAEGVTSFADTASAPNTWTVNGGASLTARRWRFHGEVPAWPVSWDQSGNDVYVEIEASGILRRLGQGAAPLKSTLYRGLTTLADDENRPFAYWPMEDGSGSAFMTPAIGGMRMNISGGEPSLAASSVFACSDAIVTCANGGFNGKVPASPSSNFLQMMFLLAIPTGGTTNGAIVARAWTTGTLRRWDLRYNTSSTGSFNLLAYDRDLTLVHTSSLTLSPLNGRAFRVSIELEQDGANIDYTFRFVAVDELVVNGAAATISSQTFGQATSVSIDPNLNMDDVTVGHLSVHSEFTFLSGLMDELTAYVGETAGRRIERLCREEGIAFTAIGDLDLTEPMGAQTPGAFLELLNECAEADRGILFEPRERFGLGYRTRETLYNQATRIELDIDDGDLAAALEPVDDDEGTRNDVTVSRKGGSSARYELTSGPMSTLPPPDGVGPYDESVTVNILGDPRLLQHASWRVHEGTVDEARYPTVSVNLAGRGVVGDPALAEALLDLEFGDRLTIDNPPPELPPDQISQLVQGYAETMGAFEHRMDLNCSPETPLRVGVYGQDRYDTCDSELSSAAGDSDTSLLVATTEGPGWTTDGANMPFDVRFGGERATVSAIAPAVTDAFARTVSSGWGSTDTGQTWTVSGPSTSEFSVSSGSGRHSMASVNFSRWSTTSLATASFDFTATVATSVLAAGGSQFVYVLGRFVDTNNNYEARVEFTTTATVALTIRKRVTGTETQLVGGTVAGLTHVANTPFAVRFRGSGSTLSAKIWPASGAEPQKWHAVVTDTDLSSGSIGFRTLLAGSNTNPSPTAMFDAVSMTNPQTFAVTRGVNGVTKSHSAGTPLSLADPVVYAL